MRMAAAVFCVLLAVMPASGQWQRFVYSGKGEFSDVPSPRPLRYFTANPFLRDDGGDLCRSCTPAGKAESAREFSIRTVTKPLGFIAGYRILDVLYYVSARTDPNHDQVKWKSILVRVGPDRYREIFHLQAYYTTISIARSRVVRSGNELVLATMDPVGGNGGDCWEGYWSFDRSGPHVLDFSRLKAAIKARIPENTSFNMSCSFLDLKSEEVHSAVQKSDARCHACDYVGEVTARFRLDGWIANPVTVSFRPWDP